MYDLSKTISEYVEEQFPAVYREDGPNLVAFMKAYFEFLENDTYSATKLNRSMFENRDVDETLDRFISSFNTQYLNEFPYIKSTDTRFAIKHIMDFYRSKGTPLSTNLLIRLLFNEDATVYYPGQDVFKLSDSKWFIPKYLEVTKSSRTSSFVNSQVTGSRSGATAFVEGIVTKRIQGRLIDIVYLSNVKGFFVNDELISDDVSNYGNSPRTIGSLSSFTITNGGRNNIVGDIFNVIDDTGKQGQIRVTGIENATGRVDFELVDGGSGYTLNNLDDADTTNDYTDVYVSTAMIGANNSATVNPLVRFETIKQNKETITLLTSTDINTEYSSNAYAVTDYLLGVRTYTESYSNTSTPAVDGANTVFPRSTVSDANNVYVVVTNNSVTAQVVSVTEYSSNDTHITFTVPPEADGIVKVIEYNIVANGGIISIANTNANGETISVASANSSALLFMNSGTFANQISVDFQNTAPFTPNEIVYEEASVELTVANSAGFTVSDMAEMRILSAPSEVGNTQLITTYAYGTVTDANTTTNVVTLQPAWGTFTVGEDLEVYYANGSVQFSSNIESISVISAGAIGTLSSNTDSNTWVIEVTSGTFTEGNNVRGLTSKVIETISANGITAIGATEVWYNGNTSANGIIDTMTDSSVSGILVGDNTTFIGVYGNTEAFSYIEGAGFSVTTVREDIREHDLGTYPNRVLEITILGAGASATFQPGSLENEETVSLNVDFINSNNVVGVNYLDIGIDGSGSGVGFVDSVTIDSGGTGYSNGTFITFSGGGSGSGNPTVSALGEITTNASGVITSIAMTNVGEGYYSVPTAILPATGGTTATVTPVMTYGYGFPKNPYGGPNTAFEDLFTYSLFTMGTITSLTRINPGANYSVAPFVSVHNKYIASYNRKGIIVLLSITSGSFSLGENVTQDGVVKGTITAIGTGYITIKRASFNITWSASQIIGQTSGASATYISSLDDGNSEVMGDNAIITSDVLVADGVATDIEVIDSGYGYLGEQEMTLVSSNSNQTITITATSHVNRHGIGTGSWKTTTSHASDSSKLHDNDYYQEYSYDIQTGVSINRYRDIVKNVLHVSGTKLFGTVIKNSLISVPVSAPSTTVTIE